MPFIVPTPPPAIGEPLARRRRRAEANGKLDAAGRRADMCRAAAQLFRDRGFDATSVSDVARALGLTKAGLYHHFESKEALLHEIMTFGLERVRDEVVVPIRAIRDPEERLRELIVRHARIATRGQGAVTCGRERGSMSVQVCAPGLSAIPIAVPVACSSTKSPPRLAGAVSCA